MEPSNYLRAAQENEEKGDKKAKGSFFKNMFSSKGERLDDARDFYEKAANSYKLANKWEKAGEMYKKCADCERQTDGMPAQYIMDAMAWYKKVSSAEFLSMAEDAIRNLAEEGRINQAARLRKEVAENYEQQYEYETAAVEYEKAAQLYEMEESISFANQWYVKAADLMVMLKDVNFEKVINTYEKVITEYMKKDLLKGSAKNLIVKVWLCYLANDDLIGARNRSQNFALEDPGFGNCREGDLLNSIYTAKEACDEDQFQKELHNYARITPFDKVVTQLLVHVKETFGVGGGLNLAGNDEKDEEPDFT